MFSRDAYSFRYCSTFNDSHSILYTEYIVRIILEQWNKDISLEGLKISNLTYTDDATLFAHTKEGMEHLPIRLDRTSKSFGFVIYRHKTKMMIVNRTWLATVRLVDPKCILVPRSRTLEGVKEMPSPTLKAENTLASPLTLQMSM